MKMMVNYAHDFLKEIMSNQDIAVDFTMGNGHDTLFLAKHAKQVYAFDIQRTALEKTAKRLEEAGLNAAFLTLDQVAEVRHRPGVYLIEDDHAFCRQYLPYFKAGIFNLGYLPGQKHEITTLAKTTLIALKDALDLLIPGGRIVLVVYPGHEAGRLESQAIDCFVQALDGHDYQVMSLSMANKHQSPYLVVIEKVQR